MKRLMVLMVISFLVGMLVSCGVEAVPPPDEYKPPEVQSVPSSEEDSPPETEPISPPEEDNSSQDDPPLPSSDNDTSGNNSSNANNSNSASQQDTVLTLPSYSEVPPGDILSQIAYGGKGAGGDEESEEPNFVFEADGEITFTGQTPYQRIRLIAYKGIPDEGCGYVGLANYLTEWHITLDENGYYRGYIEGDLTNIEIVALDADTGEEIIRSREWGKAYVDFNKVCQEMEQSCWPAPPQRMVVGEPGYVCTATDNVKVRDYPSKSGNEIVRIPPGTYFNVQDGPSCSDNWSWWYIQTDDGIEGWVSEGGDEIDPYFICPAE